MDRRKIFGLVQSIRKDTENRVNIIPSASAMTSGLRQPQTYSSRLPQPDNFNNNTSTNRGRRQSVIGSPTVLKSPPQQQQTLDRPIRNRTMSDAPRPDPSLIHHQRQAPYKDRRTELRRSLYMEQPLALDDEDDSDQEDSTKNRKFRASTPLLDAYGVPLTPAKQRSAAAAGSHPVPTVFHNLPPSDLNQKIRVCVRKRPLSRKELEKADKDVAPMNGTRSLQINEPK